MATAGRPCDPDVPRTGEDQKHLLDSLAGPRPGMGLPSYWERGAGVYGLVVREKSNKDFSGHDFRGDYRPPSTLKK